MDGMHCFPASYTDLTSRSSDPQSPPQAKRRIYVRAILLGKFELRLDADRTERSSRPSRSLLAYLALQSDTKVRRDRLAGILWPEAAESSARSNLRQALWQLRQAVSDQRIAAGKDSIRLPVDDTVWTDVDRLLQPPTGSADPDAWIEWASLYQGELPPGWYEE